MTDVAGNTLVTSGQVVNDSAAPADGSVDATGLANGVYVATITITGNSGSEIYFKDSPLIVPVTLTVGPVPPPPPAPPVRAFLPVISN